METNVLKSMPLAQLWKLDEQVIDKLRSKLVAEKIKLEQRLCQLQPQDHRIRRPYPKVFPKYQNPKNPTETWSGRGRQALWLSPQLRSEKNSTISEFIIRLITLVAYKQTQRKRLSDAGFYRRSWSRRPSRADRARRLPQSSRN
jgi:DNA-binding protein H-NS